MQASNDARELFEYTPCDGQRQDSSREGCDECLESYRTSKTFFNEVEMASRSNRLEDLFTRASQLRVTEKARMNRELTLTRFG